MVINESALLRAMREDYKGQGYTVARRAEIEADPESESILLLSANDWMVEIGWKNVSAKIFGLVAEHMKGLPEVGQAFKVKKKETNTVIFDMVENFPKHKPRQIKFPIAEMVVAVVVLTKMVVLAAQVSSSSVMQGGLRNGILPG